MFHGLAPAVLDRMAGLEALDAADRTDGTPHGRRLRQMPPEIGRYLAILAALAAACARPGAPGPRSGEKM